MVRPPSSAREFDDERMADQADQTSTDLETPEGGVAEAPVEKIDDDDRPWERLEALLDQSSSGEPNGDLIEPIPESEEPADPSPRMDADQPDAAGDERVDVATEVTSLVGTLSAPDARRALLNLTGPNQLHLLELLPSADAAALVEGLPSEMASDLVSRLVPETAAHIVEALHTDAQADVLGEMAEADADAILAEMTPQEAETVRRLAAYDDNTAGGLMNAEAFQFRQDETVGAVLRGLASEDDDFERYRGQHPYITDDEGRLVGVVSLRGLLTSNRRSRLERIMSPAIGVAPDVGLDELAGLFEEHPFFGLPVVDEETRLIGVVSRSAVADAELERAESSSLARQGVSEELRAMPTLLRSRRRLAWLSANIVLNIIAASVISAYEATLTAVIAIAVFLPMVSDMSGCSGNQAVAVTLRELALGLIRPADAARVWLKEVSVGLINGAVLGVLIALVCWVWKGNPWLGLVIGLALALNTVIAVSIGGVVPLLLKRFRQDPAVASGPLLTTVTDMAGFFLVLSLASLFMPLLID